MHKHLIIVSSDPIQARRPLPLSLLAMRPVESAGQLVVCMFPGPPLVLMRQGTFKSWLSWKSSQWKGNFHLRGMASENHTNFKNYFTIKLTLPLNNPELEGGFGFRAAWSREKYARERSISVT